MRDEKMFDVIIVTEKEEKRIVQTHLRLSKLSAYRVIKQNLETSDIMFVKKTVVIEQIVFEAVKKSIIL